MAKQKSQLIVSGTIVYGDDFEDRTGYAVIEGGKIKEIGEGGKIEADVVAMSALLTTTREYMAEVIQYFREEGLEVKIMVGGGAVSEDYAEEIGADAYGKDAVDAVSKAKELILIG